MGAQLHTARSRKGETSLIDIGRYGDIYRFA
jgi:hypothetical protein